MMAAFRKFLGDPSFLGCVKYVFWQPACGPLWFLRDLMLVSLLSWPLYHALRKGRWMTLVVLCLAALSTTQCQTASLFSFAVGGYLSINKVDIQRAGKGIVAVAGVSCASLLACSTCLRNGSNAIPVLSWGTAVLLWVLYDKAARRRPMPDMAPWRSGFFFVYLSHEPWLNLACSQLSGILPGTFLADAFFFVAVQALVMTISLWLAGFLNHRFHGLYNLMTGKR